MARQRGRERNTFDLEHSGIAQKKKARHADVPFALGAAVSRGPSLMMIMYGTLWYCTMWHCGPHSHLTNSLALAPRFVYFLFFRTCV